MAEEYPAQGFSGGVPSSHSMVDRILVNPAVMLAAKSARSSGATVGACISIKSARACAKHTALSWTV